MLNPMTAGNFYKKYEKPSDYPELSSTFDYQFKGNKLVGANENISLSGPIDYTVVGSPTINNGTANEFSDTSYLTVEFPTTIPTKTECIINFTTGDTITGSSNQSILNFVDFLNIEINTSGQLYTYDYTKKQRVGNVNLATNTNYYCKILFENNQKTLSLSTDDINYTTFADFNDAWYVSYSGYVCLGKHPTNTGRFFQGSIDLNETYIKINDQLWFGKKYRKKTLTEETIPVPANFTVGSFTTPCNGMFNVVDQSFTPYADYPIVKTDSAMLPVSTYNVKGKNACTVVGSPTINNGVLSNFNSSNYLTVANNSEINNDFELQTKILPATENPSAEIGLVTFGDQKCGVIADRWGNVKANLVDTNFGNASMGLGNRSDTIFVRLVVQPSAMQVYKSYDNGSTFTLLGTLNASVTSLLNEDLNIGKASVSYDGSIDLKETYVKANGEYWFKPYPTPVPQLVGPVTYTTYGSPSIVDGVLNYTSFNDYLLLNEQLTWNEETNLHIYSRFKTPSSFTDSDNAIISTTPDSTPFLWIWHNYIFFPLPNTNVSVGEVTTNTWYRIEIISKNNVWTRTLYDDSNNVINTVSHTITTSGSTLTRPLSIFRDYNGNRPVEAVDLNETYIKINGSLWFGKETWQPSRYEGNAMYMLVGHKADYSKYNNLGFAPTITNSGTFDLWLDNQKVQSSVASSTNLALQWDKLALTTGYTVSTPEALKAHTLKVVPTSSTEHIEQIQTYRVDSSIDNDEYGTLWYDFNLENEIKLNNLGGSSTVISPACQLVTAKNDEIKFNTNGISYFATRIQNVKHLPTLNGSNKSSNLKYAVSALSNLTYIKIKNVIATDTNALFNESRALEKITLDNVDLTTSSDTQNSNWFFKSNYSLKQLPLKPNVLFNSAQLSQCLTQDMALYPTDIDLSSNETANKIGIYGISSRRIDGVKSLLLSPNAPLDGTSPQVDVSYTGLDRNALHNLFASLPLNTEQGTVKTVNITGATGADELLQEDIDLLTELGWTQTGGTVIPDFTQEWLGDNPTNSQIGDVPIDTPSISTQILSAEKSHLFTTKTINDDTTAGITAEIISAEKSHLFTTQKIEEDNTAGVLLEIISATKGTINL